MFSSHYLATLPSFRPLPLSFLPILLKSELFLPKIASPS